MYPCNAVSKLKKGHTFKKISFLYFVPTSFTNSTLRRTADRNMSMAFPVQYILALLKQVFPRIFDFILYICASLFSCSDIPILLVKYFLENCKKSLFSQNAVKPLNNIEKNWPLNYENQNVLILRK